MKTRALYKTMDSITGPVVAGIIVSLLNRYALDFKWCTLPENWHDVDVDCENEVESDVSPSSSTAISSDMFLTHHISTHSY